MTTQTKHTQETSEQLIIRQMQAIGELTHQLQQIHDMCMGDGLDYCRSLTEPKPMTEREMVHHAPIIRGCFMGIAHKARAALAKARGEQS